MKVGVVILLAVSLLVGCSRQTTSDNTVEETPTEEQKGKAVLYPGRSFRYQDKFRDNNKLHLAAATAIGLKRKPKDREDAKKMKGNLKEIRSCKNYVVDDLTHSIPYLTPKAAAELDAIGNEFADILSRNGLPHYRFRVTSILRTEDDIHRLQRSGNVNSTSNSAHCYGTTFDLAYYHYEKMSRSSDYVPEDNLKLVLGQVLLNEQRKGHIYVKYEGKQCCFHITCR